MIRTTIIAAIAALALVAASPASTAKPPRYDLELVSVVYSAPGVGTATFTVTEPLHRAHTNRYWFVALVTSCAGDVRLGGAAWVAPDGQPYSLAGDFVGTDCSAWVYRSARGDLFTPESDVVSFA